MASKKADNSNFRKVISIETKKEIIRKYENGAKQKDLAVEYGLHKNTVQTILSKKDKIKKANVAKGVCRLTPLRKPLGDQMENLLLLWLEERQIKGFSSCQNLIRKKAKMIYQDLKSNVLNNQVLDKHQEFRASRGWFSKFCKRAGLFKVNVHEEVKQTDNNSQRTVLKENKLYVFGQPLSKSNEAEENSEGVPKVKEENIIESSISDPVGQEVLIDHQKPFIFEELQRLDEVDKKGHSAAKQLSNTKMPMNLVKDLLIKWEEVWNLVYQWHPNQSEVIRVGNMFEETAMEHFRLLLEEREKHIPLNCIKLEDSIKQGNSFSSFIKHGEG